MEELRSTELLDKEILEDARVKAEHILQSADKEAEKILSSVSQKIDALRQEKELVFQNKLAYFKKDLDAKIPLKKQRFKVSFQTESVRKQMYTHIMSLPLEEKNKVYESMLRSYSDVIAEPSFIVKECYYDKDALVSIVTNVFGKKSIDIESLKVCETGILHKNSVEGYKPEGFVLEAKDGSIVCRVMLEELIEGLIDTYSFDLVDALFSGRLPE